MKLLVAVAECESFPKGFGQSYRDYLRDITWCSPIPLNWIIGLWHRAYILLMRGFFPTRHEGRIRKRISEAHSQGVAIGRAQVQREWDAAEAENKRLADALMDKYFGSRWDCPKCKRKNDSEWTRCAMCGMDRPEEAAVIVMEGTPRTEESYVPPRTS